jgi:hypothetical protein
MTSAELDAVAEKHAPLVAELITAIMPDFELFEAMACNAVKLQNYAAFRAVYAAAKRAQSDLSGLRSHYLGHRGCVTGISRASAALCDVARAEGWARTTFAQYHYRDANGDKG